MWSLRNGLKQLPDTLAEYLTNNNVDIMTGTSCEHIVFEEGKVKVSEKWVHPVGKILTRWMWSMLIDD